MSNPSCANFAEQLWPTLRAHAKTRRSVVEANAQSPRKPPGPTQQAQASQQTEQGMDENEITGSDAERDLMCPCHHLLADSAPARTITQHTHRTHARRNHAVRYACQHVNQHRKSTRAKQRVHRKCSPSMPAQSPRTRSHFGCKIVRVHVCARVCRVLWLLTDRAEGQRRLQHCHVSAKLLRTSGLPLQGCPPTVRRGSLSHHTVQTPGKLWHHDHLG